MSDFTSTQLSGKNMRRTYLVTYSSSDLALFPSGESFGKAIAEAFASGTSKVKVEYWACALEYHKDGCEHYHASVKLDGPKRWLSVRNSLSTRCGAVVNFSESHDNYYSAYKYICKADNKVHHSVGHPDLKEIGSPRTKQSAIAYIKKQQKYTADKIACSSSTSSSQSQKL
jgi:hypothetical protein